MIIDTKFKIGDLVRYKYQRTQGVKNNSPIAAVVQFVHTETCSAGTQVFYHLRFLYQLMKHEYGFKENGIVDIVPGPDPTNQKYREEELIALPEDVVKIITNAP